MNAQKLLDRLEKVTDHGEGKYTARCPGHEDRTPSLRIRVVEDRILIHCFAGCAPLAIVGSVGLSLSDLFEARLSDAAPLKAPFGFALEAGMKHLRKDLSLIVLAAENVRHGVPLYPEDLASIEQAERRCLETLRLIR